MELHRRFVKGILVMIAAAVFCPLVSFAQSAATTSDISYALEDLPDSSVVGDFVVGPGKLEIEVLPGQSGRVEFMVTNRIGEARDFEFSVEDIAGTRDGSRSVVLLGDDRGPYALGDYVQIPNEPITIGHAQRARISLPVTVPPDAEPGGRYGSVLVQTVSKHTNQPGAGTRPQAPIVARIGTLFFLTVPGDTLRAGATQEITTVPSDSWFSQGPIRLSVLFENTGSVHLNPYGEIRITNMFDEEVGFIELEPWFALPESLRLREVVWEREFLFGRYTATAHINRGYDDIIDTMEVQFWVIPWKIILGTFVLVFFVLYALRMLIRNFEFRRKS